MRHPDGMMQRLAVADIIHTDTFHQLIPRGGAWCVYSDPPWNPGNEKWWRRHAGAEPPSDYNELLDAWCQCVVDCWPEHVFCEQSVNDKHRAMFTEAVERCEAWTLPLLEEWTVYYGSPGSRGCSRPNKLLHFGHEPLRTDPSELHGIHMTRCVFEGLDWPDGATVADPCIGKGMTSRLAHEFGLHCVGTELAEKRLAYTTAWLEKKGYRDG
jgi:hypothetical protein